MASRFSSLINSRQLPPETIWLEPEQIEQAKAMSARAIPEAQQWQVYLNALALLSFEQWLHERIPEYSIECLDESNQSGFYIEANGFKFCLIAVEHVLDETVQIPRSAVDQPDLTAHFYVVLEVSEEQELVMVRGFLRFDELTHYCRRYPCHTQTDHYQFPLALLDAEPNHLLFYCRALQPAAIALPISPLSLTDSVLGALTQTTTKLAEWLQNVVDESWQTMDQFINPEAYLALSTRSIEAGVRRGKLINLGVQLRQQTVALLVNVTSETAGKLGVLVQLYPTGEARYLLPNLKLSLRSSAGQTLQEVVSRGQDNYIQLKFFKGRPGTCFSVTIQLGSEIVEENFEL
jgi:hypothetical protein